MTTYGFDENKAKVEVASKVDVTSLTTRISEAETDITFLNSRMATAEGEIDALQQSSGTSIIGGTGISIGADGKTINHRNSISAGSVGSGTSIPVLTFDAQGHCTNKTFVTVYPPTTAGTAGQVWTSDGSGVGSWQTPSQTPSSGDEWTVSKSQPAYTDLFSRNSSTDLVTIVRDFKIVVYYHNDVSVNYVGEGAYSEAIFREGTTFYVKDTYRSNRMHLCLTPLYLNGIIYYSSDTHKTDEVVFSALTLTNNAYSVSIRPFKIGSLIQADKETTAVYNSNLGSSTTAFRFAIYFNS